MAQKTKRQTSVHVDIETHNTFKHMCVENKVTFQALVNAVLKKYVNDAEFRQNILK